MADTEGFAGWLVLKCFEWLLAPLGVEVDRASEKPVPVR